MNETLLMEISDCGSPERLAQIIHKHIPFPDDGPSDLDAIAEAVGISEIKPARTSQYEGILITDEAKSKGAILYNESSNPYRRRFTIAHELGHYLLPFHDKNAQCASSDMRVLKERGSNLDKESEANRFAIELLAPQNFVRSSLSSKSVPDLKQLTDLHKRFEISKEAMARRFIECTDYDVSFVFAKADKVRYTIRTRDFPYLCLSKDEMLPPHIREQVKDANVGEIVDWYYVDPHYFLSQPRFANGKQLYCQTLIQEEGFSISLLSLEEE